jgi:hypothetical protein
MSDEGRPACEIHRDENGEVFVLVGGRKIAKRGLPHTAQPDTWIMLEPGWTVRDASQRPIVTFSYSSRDEAINAQSLVAKALENAKHVGVVPPRPIGGGSAP